MAGEIGNIIDPYRVAPAQGGIREMLMMAGQMSEQEQAYKKQALDEATRGFLRQQLGIQGLADPMAVQGFNGEQQKQQIAGAQENRNAVDFQHLQDFTNNFVGAAQKNFAGDKDPYMQTLLASGMHPQAAQAMSNFLGQRGDRQGQLDNRIAINNADNLAAGQRNDADNIARGKQLDMELSKRGQFEQDKDARATSREDAMMKQAMAAVNKYVETGDPQYLMGIDPRLAGSEVFNMQLEGARTNVKNQQTQKQLQDEIAKKKLEAASGSASSQGLTPEQSKQIQLERVKTMMGDQTIEQFSSKVANESQNFGGGDKTAISDLQAQYPEAYNAAWNAMQQQKQAAEYEKKLRYAKMTKEQRMAETMHQTPGFGFNPSR